MCSQQGVLFGTATDSTERKLALRAGLIPRYAGGGVLNGLDHERQDSADK
jgi:hypothetical protein